MYSIVIISHSVSEISSFCKILKFIKRLDHEAVVKCLIDVFYFLVFLSFQTTWTTAMTAVTAARDGPSPPTAPSAPPSSFSRPPDNTAWHLRLQHSRVRTRCCWLDPWSADDCAAITARWAARDALGSGGSAAGGSGPIVSRGWCSAVGASFQGSVALSRLCLFCAERPCCRHVGCVRDLSLN